MLRPPPGTQNGIIHNCTHGNNPDVKLTEDEMIVKIFTYLDKLFHIVKPQASAPASMNFGRAMRRHGALQPCRCCATYHAAATAPALRAAPADAFASLPSGCAPG